MKTLTHLWNARRDALISALICLLACALYLRTLAPSVAFLFDDTLEFQYVVPRLGIIHQTGYPFYALLGKLFTLIVPLNAPAFRLNLLSALNGALAVAMVYLVIRHLTAYRIAALIGALTFAVGPTFWSQAVIAETYSTQMLIVAILLYLALAWREEHARGNADAARHRPFGSAQGRFYALAFTMGLGLTHHRLILLLYPAITVYVLLVDRSILRDFKTLARAALLFIAPLLLYLYLPLRGSVGSADGTYENTLQGFIAWVTAQQYFTFFGNPFNVQHDAAFYWSLFNAQFTVAGIALAALGVVALLRRPREWVLLAVALLAEAGFAFNYHTANVQVHFLTMFLLLALFLSVGIDALQSFTFYVSRFAPLTLLVGWLLFLIPANLLLANYPTNQLANKWDVHDYGLDILNQPLENNATIIGIQGEMTLLRYFQETQGLRPDVQTIAADKEDARLAAIADALRQNRVVYLTRQLKGAAKKYSLSSLGPLIRVNPQPVMGDPKHAQWLGESFGADITLLGVELDPARLNALPGRWHAENGRGLRVTLHWLAAQKIESDVMVSVKVLRRDRRVVGQTDHRPVLDAYPTTAWRAGEIIVDTYAVPLWLGVTPGEYIVNVTLYDANSGGVIGQRDLDKITLEADVTAPRRDPRNGAHAAAEYLALSLAGYSLDAWNVARIADADFGVLSLVGYALDASAPARPGDALPLTLLWRAGALKLPDNLMARIWLDDSEGRQITSRDTLISVGYPPFQWQPHTYVRDWSPMRIPANVADGKYAVKLAVARNNQLLGTPLLPFRATVVDLGSIEIKNRARVMTAPNIPRALEAAFDQKIKLLGYDLQIDSKQSTAQVTLYWRALALMDTPYTVFVHLLDAQNNVIAAGDAPPGNDQFPTTGWIEGEYMADAHTLTLPADLPPGMYPIEIGVYDPATGVRLKTSAAEDRVLLPALDLP